MSPKEKEKILKRLERLGRIQNEDLEQLRADVNKELDTSIKNKKQEFRELYLDIQLGKLNINHA